MIYSSTLYARSLFLILSEVEPAGHSLIFKNFWKTVLKNGDQSKLKNIIDSFEELVVRSRGGRVIILETARESDDLLEKLKRLFKPDDLVKKIINPKLVSGVRVELDHGMELDYSLERKFRKIFIRGI